ncbi:hypothetical protein ACIO93_12825 [Streptomyces sp. NPDC087903]
MSHQQLPEVAPRIGVRRLGEGVGRRFQGGQPVEVGLPDVG